VAIFTLAASTVVVALCAEFMVDSIDAITKNGGISKTFVGLILLPIVGNAAEHATAVTVAVKDKMDLAIGVAVGSSMQIALLVLPFTVVLGWIMGKDNMNLNFDGFQIAVLFVAVLLVNYLIQDGKSHWYAHRDPGFATTLTMDLGWRVYCCKHCTSSLQLLHGSIPQRVKKRDHGASGFATDWCRYHSQYGILFCTPPLRLWHF
jgi:hypothetical protein